MATDTDRIFSEFKEHSVAEFFKKNRQMLGFSGKTRSLTVIVHEYITNSLDACEEAGILPEITVKIDEIDKEKYRVGVQDNGPGIPKKHVGKALGQMLAGTKFHRFAQQRGQQGIGASGCTMYAQITTGKPVKFVSEYDSKRIRGEISVDVKTNTPKLDIFAEEENPEKTHGVHVEGEFGECKYDRSSFGAYEYVKRTALANPHATITLIEPTGERLSYPRSHAVVPPKPESIQPHPLGLTISDLIEMAHHEPEFTRLSSFLQNRFSRVSSAKVQEVAALAQEVDFNKKPKDLEWSEAEMIIKAFSQVKWMAPATDCVRPIGREQIEKSLRNILGPQFVAVTERSPKIYRGGIAFMAEAALAYGGGAGKRIGDSVGGDIIRYANGAPLLFDAAGCAITEAVKEIDWKRYHIRNFEEEPISVLVNVASVYVPYTTAGKQAISQEEEVYMEIKNAVMEAARELQRHLSGLHREKDRANRRAAVMRYVRQLSKDLSELANKGKAEELNKKLVHLIETKYMGQIEDGEDDDGGNGKNGKNGKNGNGEEDEKEE